MSRVRADKGNRTPDLRITSASLYRLSHIGMPYKHSNILSNLFYKINYFFQKVSFILRSSLFTQIIYSFFNKSIDILYQLDRIDLFGLFLVNKKSIIRIVAR